MLPGIVRVSGIEVSSIGLGTFNFGGPTPEAEAIGLIHHAIHCGVNLVDTANTYQGGKAEELIGRALVGCRANVFLATKGGLQEHSGDNIPGNSRQAIISNCESSLRRLQTDWIDLYQLHSDDPETHLDETCEALLELVQTGKVLNCGISNFAAYRAALISERAAYSGLRIASIQSPYSLVEREVEYELTVAAVELSLLFLAWSPLAMGLLTERFIDGATPPEARVTRWHAPSGTTWTELRRAIDELHRIASQVGVSLASLAIAWLLARPGHVIPIIGPRTRSHLDIALRSLAITLDEAVLEAIDQAVPPKRSYWLRTHLRNHAAE